MENKNNINVQMNDREEEMARQIKKVCENENMDDSITKRLIKSQVNMYNELKENDMHIKMLAANAIRLSDRNSYFNITLTFSEHDCFFLQIFEIVCQKKITHSSTDYIRTLYEILFLIRNIAKKHDINPLISVDVMRREGISKSILKVILSSAGYLSMMDFPDSYL